MLEQPPSSGRPLTSCFRYPLLSSQALKPTGRFGIHRAVASSLGSWLRLPLPQGLASSTVFWPYAARLAVLAPGCGKG